MSKEQLNGATIQKQQSEYVRKKAMVAEVEMYELAARKFKAEFEMMDYAMKVHALKPSYQEFAYKVMKEAEAFAKAEESTDVKEDVQDA